MQNIWHLVQPLLEAVEQCSKEISERIGGVLCNFSYSTCWIADSVTPGCDLVSRMYMSSHSDVLYAMIDLWAFCQRVFSIAIQSIQNLVRVDDGRGRGQGGAKEGYMLMSKAHAHQEVNWFEVKANTHYNGKRSASTRDICKWSACTMCLLRTAQSASAGSGYQALECSKEKTKFYGRT